MPAKKAGSADKQADAFLGEDGPGIDDAPSAHVGSGRRANDLDGRAWTRYSISVWRDIKKSPEERALKHPAMFPSELVERLILCFTRSDETVVLDPFCGSGSTLVAAQKMGRTGIGFELSEDYARLARSRLSQRSLLSADNEHRIHAKDARRLSEDVGPESVDLVVTSPPYWNILNQKRSADYKEIRNYGNYDGDLGNIASYEEFILELTKIWRQVHGVLKKGKYFVVNVMDLRKGPSFIPFHMDITRSVADCGFIFDDTIIWDRSGDYNNLRALGYPAVFRINKVHEFLLVFRKPT